MIKNEKLDSFYLNIRLYRDLLPISKALHRLGELDCNVGLTSRQEKRIDNLLVKANNFAHACGFKVYHQSDPRGCALYLVPDDNQSHSNDYTDGVAIY